MSEQQMKSWRPMIRATGESRFAGNGLRFATESEAREAANDTFMRWFAAEEFGAEQSSDPVKHIWRDGKAIEIPEVKEFDESDEAPDPEENPSCPTCGGIGVPLGTLGRKEYFRCQGCGTDFSAG